MLAVDNLNGVDLCGRSILVDHVKQYKIPREFYQISEDEQSENSSDDSETKKKKWEQKVFKPTGPDGRGWGELRNCTMEEEVILEEIELLEKKEAKRKEKLILMQESMPKKIITEVEKKEEKDDLNLNENERWEKML